MTIGHGAIIHACTIESEVLIGMGAKVLDGAVVRQGAIVGAGAVVAPGTEVPSGPVWVGQARTTQSAWFFSVCERCKVQETFAEQSAACFCTFCNAL